MITKCLTGEPNTGILTPTNKPICIKKGRYILDTVSHPLKSSDGPYYKRTYCLAYKNQTVYWFPLFGARAETKNNHGHHVGFSYWEHQQFLWLQNEQWFQKEKNIRYLVNIIFLLLGITLGIMTFLKS